MLKKISAAVMAIITILSLVTFAFASEENEGIVESVKLYDCPSDESSYILVIAIDEYLSYEKEFFFSENGKLFKINSDRERTLLKEFNYEDCNVPEWKNSLTPTNNFLLLVSKDFFAEGCEYVITLPKQSVRLDGTFESLPVEFSFSYSDLLGGNPVFAFNDIEIEISESTDLNQFILFPLGYSGEFFIMMYSENENVKLENGTVISSTKSNSEIRIFDKYSYENFDIAQITFIDDNADGFGELVKYSADKLFNGGINAAQNSGMIFLESVATVFYPFVIILSLPLMLLGF